MRVRSKARIFFLNGYHHLLVIIRGIQPLESADCLPLNETKKTIKPTMNAARANQASVLETGMTSRKPKTAITGIAVILKSTVRYLECLIPFFKMTHLYTSEM